MGISARQFEQLQKRVSDKKTVAPQDAVDHSLILGVDPSLRGTGFGVVRLDKENPVTLAQGTIKCPAKWSRTECLVAISKTFREVISAHRPMRANYLTKCFRNSHKTFRAAPFRRTFNRSLRKRYRIFFVQPNNPKPCSAQ